MKLLKILIVLLSFTFILADHKISVTRIDSNVYRIDSGWNRGGHITTRYCYVYAYRMEAILDDEWNKLIFENGESCDVVGVHK